MKCCNGWIAKFQRIHVNAKTPGRYDKMIQTIIICAFLRLNAYTLCYHDILLMNYISSKEKYGQKNKTFKKY